MDNVLTSSITDVADVEVWNLDTYLILWLAERLPSFNEGVYIAPAADRARLLGGDENWEKIDEEYWKDFRQFKEACLEYKRYILWDWEGIGDAFNKDEKKEVHQNVKKGLRWLAENFGELWW